MKTLSIAFRNIFRNIRRTTIIFLSISAAMTAIIIFGGFINYTFEGLKESTIRTQLGHFQIAKTGFFTENLGNSDKYLFGNFENLEKKLLEIDDVQAVSNRLTGSGLITVGHSTLSAMLIGVSPEKDKGLSYHEVITDGKQLSDNRIDECVIGSLLAKGLDAKIGDVSTILSTTIDGTINAVDCNIVGIVKTSANDYDKVYVKMNLKNLQKLLDTTKIEKFIVLLNDTKSMNNAEQEINNLLKTNPDFEVKKWIDLAEFYNGVVKLYTSIFKLCYLILGFIIILGISNTISMSVFERFREIGTIRAIGQTKLGILYNFLLEGLLIGVIGGIIGILVGVFVAYIINITGGINIPPPPGMTSGYIAYINYDLKVIINAFLLSVVVCLISSIYPAIIAAKKDIVEALSHT